MKWTDHNGVNWWSFRSMCSAHGLSPAGVRYRLAQGMSLRAALSPKGIVEHPVTGEPTSYAALAREAGVSTQTMRDRDRAGLPLLISNLCSGRARRYANRGPIFSPFKESRT